MADSAAEVAFGQATRALDGQGADLASIRGHLNLVVTAGGIAATFLGSQASGHRWSFWIAALAFGAIAVLTILVYWPVAFAYDFDGYEDVGTYVDSDPPWAPDKMMRELAIHATDDYQDNRHVLDMLYNDQSLALALFGVEVAGLLAHLAWD